MKKILAACIKQIIQFDSEAEYNVNGITGSMNDHRAVTIEVASETEHPFAVTDAAYKALVNLVADICERNGIKELKWKADKNLVGKVEQQNMTVHRWFANKACPGDYLYKLHSKIAQEVNSKISKSSSEVEKTHIIDYISQQPNYKGKTNEETVFNFCTKILGLNAAAACGVLANFYAESGFKPTNLQNTYEKKLGFTDESYTNAVDNGSYTNFVKDSAGYGLAQWTFWSRKQKLLDYAKKKNASIGNIFIQLEFFETEIKNYKTVWECLKTVPNTAEGAYKAAHEMCYTYEAPGSKETSSVTRGNAAKNTYWKKYGTTSTEPAKPTEKLYKVQTGAFTNKANAIALQNKLKAKGFDTYIVEVGKYFKVQVGAFKDKANAEAMMKKLHAANYCDAFIVYTGSSEKTGSSSETKVGDKVKVLKAVTYDGKPFKLYYSKYDVLQINGDRVVIGIGKTVTAAINKANIQKV